mgnify:CR=1 FL=1
MPGKVCLVFQTPETGSVPRVESPGGASLPERCPLQGSGGPFAGASERVGVVPGANAIGDDESGDALILCAGAGSSHRCVRWTGNHAVGEREGCAGDGHPPAPAGRCSEVVVYGHSVWCIATSMIGQHQYMEPGVGRCCDALLCVQGLFSRSSPGRLSCGLVCGGRLCGDSGGRLDPGRFYEGFERCAQWAEGTTNNAPLTTTSSWRGT